MGIEIKKINSAWIVTIEEKLIFEKYEVMMEFQTTLLSIIKDYSKLTKQNISETIFTEGLKKDLQKIQEELKKTDILNLMGSN